MSPVCGCVGRDGVRLGASRGTVGLGDDHIVMGPTKLEESSLFMLLLLSFRAHESLSIPCRTTIVTVEREVVLL